MEVGTMLFGLVREIPIRNYDSQTECRASIEKDTDDDLALCLYSPRYNYHFRIDGLGLTDQHIDWLAWVLSNMLERAWKVGYETRSEEVDEALSGLRTLLKSAT